jgi:hypothetical protein
MPQNEVEYSYPMLLWYSEPLQIITICVTHYYYYNE